MKLIEKYENPDWRIFHLKLFQLVCFYWFSLFLNYSLCCSKAAFFWRIERVFHEVHRDFFANTLTLRFARKKISFSFFSSDENFMYGSEKIVWRECWCLLGNTYTPTLRRKESMTRLNPIPLSIFCYRFSQWFLWKISFLFFPSSNLNCSSWNRKCLKAFKFRILFHWKSIHIYLNDTPAKTTAAALFRYKLVSFLFIYLSFTHLSIA